MKYYRITRVWYAFEAEDEEEASREAEFTCPDEEDIEEVNEEGDAVKYPWNQPPVDSK